MHTFPSMKKLIPFTLIAMLLGTGVASADRGRDHRRGDDHGRRGGDAGWRDGGRSSRVVVRDRRRVVRPRLEHRRVTIRDGAFHFHGGLVKRWRAPVISRRYVDVRVVPAPVVEYYDPVPGYVWRPGQWQWTGYEWSWTAGYYDVDPAYGYDQGYGYDPRYQQGYGTQPGYDYDGDGYADPAPAPAPPPSPYPY